MDDKLRKLIYARSRGRCEAMISVGMQPAVRCPKQATEIHHLLTKARGGEILDKVHETYHLLHLCHDCHTWSDGAKAYLTFMLIDGSVLTDKVSGRPFYTGTDGYLAKRYPPHKRWVDWVDVKDGLL